MAIDIYTAQFLRSEVRRGLKLDHLLTLGRQSLSIDGIAYRRLMASLGAIGGDALFAEDLFRALGAKSIQALDFSSYEGADILRDLNEAIDDGLRGKFDCVFDGGALEHIFNLPQALKSCMEMVKLGGHLTAVTPTAAYCGHGFYQFSPELFYGAFSSENGYSLERMLFVHRGQWYSVRNPADIKERVELFTSEPTLLFISAKRTEDRPIFCKWPQQSDYTAAWAGGQKPQENSEAFKNRVISVIPLFKGLQTKWRQHKRRVAGHPTNARRFVPIRLD